MSSIVGRLDRYFLIGYFLPSFAFLAAISLLRHEPFVVAKAGALAQSPPTLVVIAALAVLIGLVLSAFYRPLVQLYEGYPFVNPRNPLGAYWRDREKERWKCLSRRIGELRRDLAAADAADPRFAELANLQFQFDSVFPPSEQDVLPTRLGNRVRAFEFYSYHATGSRASRFGRGCLASFRRSSRPFSAKRKRPSRF